jgi:hypothetical protein
MMRVLIKAVILLWAGSTASFAEPIASTDVRVIDGGTVRLYQRIFRKVWEKATRARGKDEASSFIPRDHLAGNPTVGATN